MSGWDVSSTPTWGPQDGPEDSHPGHSGEGSREFGQDYGRGGPSSPAGGFPEVGGGFPGESQAGGPPPEFFGQDYGQEHEVGPGGFPQRTPGRSFQDLPRRESRGRHSSAPGGGYGQPEGAFGQDGAFGRGQDNGYAQDNGFGHAPDNGFGQDNGFGHSQDNGYAPENGFGHAPENGFGHAPDNGFGHAPDNGFAQEGSYGQDGGYREWGGNTDQADTWGPAGNGGQDNDGGWGRPAGRSAAPWEERPPQDAGYPGPDAGQEFGQQEFGRQDYTRQAQRPSFGGPDYDGQEFPGQQELDPGFDHGERDVTARMDPALQDFFAPQRGGAPGYPGQGPGRSGEPRDPSRYRPQTDGWEDPGRSRGGTGPRPASRGPRRDEPEPRGGIGMRGLIAIGAVVAVIVVIAVVVLTHKSGGNSPAASNTPSGGTATSAAAKPTASKAAAGGGTATKPDAGGAAAAAGAFTLSTPQTAGGYPIGQDPQFLAASVTTAKQITSAVTAGGGGTVQGDPVSAAYRLGSGQVITFVGYQGTFTPAKVQTILATLANDSKTYPAGPNGGGLGCANTKATPSGAVCVWATGSTLGVTEFYDAAGPETLNAFQAKGASDTVNLRADVEKKK